MPESSTIRTVMEREGLTYRDLAFLTGLDAGYLNRIARGDKVPSRKAALRIAKALGLKPEDVPAEPMPEVVALMKLADLEDLHDLPPTLTADQVAEVWGCSTWSVYAMAKAGECPVMPLKLGRKLAWPTLGVLRSVGLLVNGESPPLTGGPSVIAPLSPDNEDRGSA